MQAAPLILPTQAGTDPASPAGPQPDGGAFGMALAAAMMVPGLGQPAAQAAPSTEGQSATDVAAGKAGAAPRSSEPILLPSVFPAKADAATDAGAQDPAVLPPAGLRGEMKPFGARPTLTAEPGKAQGQPEVGAKTANLTAIKGEPAEGKPAAPEPSQDAATDAKAVVLAVATQAKTAVAAAPALASPAQAVQAQQAATQPKPELKPEPSVEAPTDLRGKPAKAPTPSAPVAHDAASATEAAKAEQDSAATDRDQPSEQRTSDGARQADVATAKADATPTAITTAHVRGSPHTVAALSADIARKLEARHSRFEVALDPHGLGRVDVKVEVGPSGAVAAHLNFDNPQSAEMLKGRAGELHAALEQAGFDLSGGLSFTSGGEQRAHQDASSGRNAAPSRTAFAALDEAPSAHAAQSRAVADGRLDIRI